MDDSDFVPLNEVLIDPFIIVRIDRHDRQKLVDALFRGLLSPDAELQIEAGAGTIQLCSTLVRTAARRVYFAKHVPERFPPINDLVKMCPPSLRENIEIVDKNEKEFKRVSKYLEPISQEMGSIDRSVDHRNHRPHAFYEAVFDFLYKLLLASNLKAEAEIGSGLNPCEYHFLNERLGNEEAKFRLAQIYGLWRLYDRQRPIDSISMHPKFVTPSICERVHELLDTAEITDLSKDRHLLGFPNKSKATFLRIQRHVKDILSNKENANKLEAASDLIQVVTQVVASGTCGSRVPKVSTSEILKSLRMQSYNPPLLDLGILREEAARGTHGGPAIYIRANALTYSCLLIPARGND